MNQFTLNVSEPEKTPTPTPTLNADTEVKADTGILESDNNKDLCLQLIHAETEEEVKTILHQYGYWGDSDEYWDDSENWRDFADNKKVWATAGNQSANSDYALVEKLTNSMDHVLLRKCKLQGIPTEGTEQDGTPQTMRKAVEKFFNVPQGKLSECTVKEKTNLAENIKLIATGGGRRNPCYIIADRGEGQPPDKLPTTLLSSGKGDKGTIPFVQGKFNMGGTAIFRFCNFQLVLSKQDPDLSQNPASKDLWGFTIIYRKKASQIKRKDDSRIRYLAPEGKILAFAADSLDILPGKYPNAYDSPMKSGTFIKLYEYNSDSYKKSFLFRFYDRLSLLLEGTCMPIRLYEMRLGNTPRDHGKTVSGLQVQSVEPRFRDNLECDPIPVNLPPILEQMIKGKCYVFKKPIKDGKPIVIKKNYAGREGIVFSVNGQSHGTYSDSFFNNDGVKLGALADSLLVVLDCTDVSAEQKEELLMNSRDRIIRSSNIAKEIRKELQDFLKDDRELKELNEKRREQKRNEKLADGKPIKDVLDKVLKQSPVLSRLLLEGQRLPSSNPNQNSQGTIDVKLRKFPTHFDLKKQYSREIPKNYSKDTLTVSYKTDAENDYFDRDSEPGTIKLYVNNEPYYDFRTPRLYKGEAKLKINADPEWKLGQVIEVRSEITDVTQINPFVETFFIKNIEPSENSSDPSPKPKGGLEQPEPIPVREHQWPEHGFNKSSALKIESNEAGYDYYVNLDNMYLDAERRAQPKNKDILETQYLSAMVLVGLSLLHKDNKKQKSEEDEHQDTQDRDTSQEIAEITEKLSMVLLPMINGLGDLSDDKDGE